MFGSPPAQAPPPSDLPGSQPRRRRTGLWITVWALAAGAVLTVGAGAGVVVGLRERNRPEPSSSPSALAGSGTVSITKQELEALARSRSEALERRDLAAFLADLDQGNRTLVTAQTRLFTNLGRLPFAEARYDWMDQEGRAADRFGRAVAIQVDLAFVHRIEGFDAKDVAEWYRWTVVKKDRGSRPVITAVTGAPAESTYHSSTVFYPSPWDAWDLRVVRTPHVLLLVDASLAGRAQRLAPAAERAAADNVAAWSAGGGDSGIARSYVAALVPDQAQLGTIFRTAREEPTEAGLCLGMPAYDPLLARKNDNTRMGSSRVAFDLSSGYFRSPAGTQEIFRHEFAHAMVEVLRVAQFDLAPEQWPAEGFAEYLANRRVTGPGRRLADARRKLRAGAFDGKLPGPFLWASADQVSFHYYLAHQAVRYIAATYGERRAFAFVTVQYRTGNSYAALRTLGVSREAFESRWAAFVRHELR